MLDTKKFLDGESIEYQENCSAKRLCSFRVGGEVALAVLPKTADQLIATITYLRANKKKHVVLGRGSNVVFSDGRYEGAVVLTNGIDGIEKDGNRIKAGAGATLFSVARCAESNSLCGFEFAHGIPGSVGGAVYMNAGAYGGEISGVLVECECYDAASGRTLTLSRDECDFSYRHSVFQDNKDLIVLSAVFSLEAGERDKIRARMDELRASRAEKQPLEYPNAGSTFKRPEGYFAGKLIEDCGLKGFSIGGAEVSQKHAGFLINKGDATGEDVRLLVEQIKKTVFEKFTVSLECEIEFI